MLRMEIALFLVLALFGAFLLPISYVGTPQGSYSAGPYAVVSYAGVAFYLVLCAVLLFGNWRSLDRKKRFAIGAALVIEFTVCALQGLHHTWPISGMGLTLMTLAFYLTLENPDILHGELTEQKLSMLYLKSQVNPHFLYNTLDAIPHPGPAGRRQARGRSADAAGRFLPAELSRSTGRWSHWTTNWSCWRRIWS